MSPTALSLRWLRERGYTPGVTERYIAQARIRRDLFGIIDIVAIAAGRAVLGVQTSSLSNLPARVAKAKACAELAVWLSTGHAAFQVHGWALHNGRWMAKIVELHGKDMSPIIVQQIPRKRVPRYKACDLFTQGDFQNVS